MKITSPGIFRDFPTDAYFADPCPQPSLTQSIAKTLLDRSPAHARLEHPRLAPPAEEDEPAEKYVAATAIGNAAHALMLGRGKTVEMIDAPDFRGKDAQKARDAATAAGRVPILAKHHKRAVDMVRAARQQLDAAGHSAAFVDGQPEVVIAWQERGLWFRSMIDWMMRPTVVYDYKTTGLSCAPHAVEDRPSVMGWDVQAAMHERGLDVLHPEGAGRRKHFYVNQENEPPYALTIVQISEADLTMGRKKIDMAIDIWSRCLLTNTWPTYPAETILSRPRAYLETKTLEREIAHEERKAREPIPSDLLAGC